MRVVSLQQIGGGHQITDIKIIFIKGHRGQRLIVCIKVHDAHVREILFYPTVVNVPAGNGQPHAGLIMKRGGIAGFSVNQHRMIADEIR